MRLVRANFVIRVARKSWRVQQTYPQPPLLRGGSWKGRRCASDGFATSVGGNGKKKILQLHCAGQQGDIMPGSQRSSFQFSPDPRVYKRSIPSGTSFILYPSGSPFLYPLSLYPLFTPISPWQCLVRTQLSISNLQCPTTPDLNPVAQDRSFRRLKQVHLEMANLRTTSKHLIPNATLAIHWSGFRAIFPPNMALKTRRLTTTRTIARRQDSVYRSADPHGHCPPPRQVGIGRTKPTSNLLIAPTSSKYGVCRGWVSPSKALRTM